MASSIGIKMVIDIAGQPYPFAQPFTVPIIELAQDPAVFSVTVDVDNEATLWDGVPLGTTADIIALVANRAARYRISTTSGSFTLEAATAGVPTLISGGSADTGGGLEAITEIVAINPDTTNSMVVSAIIGELSA